MIGEAVLDYCEDRVDIDCEDATNLDAPAFGEPSDHCNKLMPSYGGWRHCVETLGLTDVTYGEATNKGYFQWNGVERPALIQTHPGAVPVTKDHVDFVAEKLKDYKKANPTHLAQFPPLKPGAIPVHGTLDTYMDDQYVDDPRFDYALCRGEWLLFWLRWAVGNCKKPICVNS